MVGQASGFANVNFDYNGPPVVVTNGMTLDLVVQFGIQNAWYAYLKLRGLNPSTNETEKALALKRFRNKIRFLKRSAESLRDQNVNEYNDFLSKEFNGVSNESSIVDVMTTESNSSLVTCNNNSNKSSINSDKSISKLTVKPDQENVASDDNEKNDLNEDEPGNLVIDEDVPTSANVDAVKNSLTSVLEKLKPSASSTHSINSICSTSVASTLPSKIATSSDFPTSTSVSDLNGNALIESLISKRHQETINDVVSTVMEKIRNNLPIESESSLLASSFSTASSSNQLPSFITGNFSRPLQTTKGKGNKTKNLVKQPNTSSVEQISIDEEGKVTSTAQQQQAQQQILVSGSHIIPATTTLLDGTTAAIVATLPTGQEQLTLNALRTNAASSSASSTLHQSINSDQVTILSNFTEIIRASTSSQPTNVSQFTPVTKVVTHSCQNDISTQRLQQQQQQQLCTQIPLGTNIQIPSFSVPFSANTGGIPIRISPQNTITLPNNITVQSLLQSLQQKTKKQQQFLQLTQLQLGQLQQNQPIQLQIQPTGNFQHAQQQILPDSSSQELGNTNQAQVSQAQPSNILSLSDNIDVKAPKKRQYIKRKNVTTSNTLSSDEMSVKDSVLAAIGKAGIVSLEKILSSHSSQSNTFCETNKLHHLSEAAVNAAAATNSDSKDINIITPNSKNFNSAKKLTISPATTTKKDEKTDSNEFETVKEQSSFKKKTSKIPKKIKTSNMSKKINPKKLPKSKVLKIVFKTPNETNNKLLKQKKSDTTVSISKEKSAQKIMELEKELAKCKKQLTTEKNKFLAQKKRMEKLLADIEKNSDVVQLAQIDLACQKTDNNNLIAENIALKAELQKLKSKENSKLSGNNLKTPGRKSKNFLNQVSSKDAVQSGKFGRKRLNNVLNNAPSTSSNSQQKQEKLLSDMSVEYGRRQSKRICVARKNFLTLLY